MASFDEDNPPFECDAALTFQLGVLNESRVYFELTLDSSGHAAGASAGFRLSDTPLISLSL